MTRKLPTNDYLVMLYDAGATMGEIGAEYGASPQSVQQRLARAGASTRRSQDGRTDPLYIMRAIRRSETRSWSDVERASGFSEYAAWRLCSELGLHPAVRRLFRWRKRHADA
jgi:hypothetical protein